MLFQQLQILQMSEAQTQILQLVFIIMHILHPRISTLVACRINLSLINVVRGTQLHVIIVFFTYSN